jgi:uncharacterized protein (DUF2267 family)
MSMTGVESFDATLQKTHIWLNEVMNELHWNDKCKAYSALRTTLHVLRDRLSVEEAAHLGAQLPMLIRGFYYEGWIPAGKPSKERHQEEFLAPIREHFRNDPDIDPEQVTRMGPAPGAGGPSRPVVGGMPRSSASTFGAALGVKDARGVG